MSLYNIWLTPVITENQSPGITLVGAHKRTDRQTLQTDIHETDRTVTDIRATNRTVTDRHKTNRTVIEIRETNKIVADKRNQLNCNFSNIIQVEIITMKKYRKIYSGIA